MKLFIFILTEMESITEDSFFEILKYFDFIEIARMKRVSKRFSTLIKSRFERDYQLEIIKEKKYHRILVKIEEGKTRKFKIHHLFSEDSLKLVYPVWRDILYQCASRMMEDISNYLVPTTDRSIGNTIAYTWTSENECFQHTQNNEFVIGKSVIHGMLVNTYRSLTLKIDHNQISIIKILDKFIHCLKKVN